MRAFIVLCLVAVACAQQFGYNYPSADGSNQVFVLNSGEGVIQNLGLANLAQLAQSGSAVLSEPIQGGFQNVGPAYLAPTAQSGSAVLSEPIQPAPAAALVVPSFSVPASSYNKEFYSYSAPEEEFIDPAASEKISSALKQALRVIFIKGPENKALENAALSLAKQASDQKTAIFVLNKQADVSKLANKLNVIRNKNNNKPEVHFVKYRTPEDAANAQQQIQSQYDSLAGSSQSHNGGIAPVHNFASRGPVQSAPEPRTPGNSYLPASIFRRFRL